MGRVKEFDLRHKKGPGRKNRKQPEPKLSSILSINKQQKVIKYVTNFLQYCLN